MQQYLDLLQYIFDHGAEEIATGTGTKSCFGYQMRFDLAARVSAGYYKKAPL